MLDTRWTMTCGNGFWRAGRTLSIGLGPKGRRLGISLQRSASSFRRLVDGDARAHPGRRRNPAKYKLLMAMIADAMAAHPAGVTALVMGANAFTSWRRG